MEDDHDVNELTAGGPPWAPVTMQTQKKGDDFISETEVQNTWEGIEHESPEHVDLEPRSAGEGEQLVVQSRDVWGEERMWGEKWNEIRGLVVGDDFGSGG